ncbi:hypothetical protein [Micromonospora sp. IBHARD004]|uniref:hypothetical protein n=1 Tax=Micromonospora sp. IBHARD004 TaxID=3457764 RepID=UPI004059BE72
MRGMLLISMLFGLFMNASIPEAFGEAGSLFVARSATTGRSQSVRSTATIGRRSVG